MTMFLSNIVMNHFIFFGNRDGNCREYSMIQRYHFFDSTRFFLPKV